MQSAVPIQSRSVELEHPGGGVKVVVNPNEDACIDVVEAVAQCLFDNYVVEHNSECLPGKAWGISWFWQRLDGLSV